MSVARATAFGVEGCVSTRDELAERVPVRERRQTHTNGRLGDPFRQISRHLVKPLPSSFDVAARKRAEKLVASVSDDKVVRSQLGSQRQRHVPEQLVAGSVALNVVDGLEAVDVDERENESPIRAPCPVNLPLEIDEATAASKCSGQDIYARPPARGRGQPLPGRGLRLRGLGLPAYGR